MKSIIFMMMLCALIYIVNAQKIVEKHIDFSQKKSVDLKIEITDSIKIHTWNKNEVFASASVNINDNKDNDVYLIAFDDSGKIVRITAKFKSDFYAGKPNCYNDEICWDIYIPENIGFAVNTVNGNLIIAGKTSEIDAHTVSGFIDLTVPSDKKANLTCKTVSGTIYSNHEFVTNNTGHSPHPEISEKINGGGSTINLETVSGDIYYRESE